MKRRERKEVKKEARRYQEREKIYINDMIEGKKEKRRY